ncbi:hypothetical protein [Kaarinaea lacus]
MDLFINITRAPFFNLSQWEFLPEKGINSGGISLNACLLINQGNEVYYADIVCLKELIEFIGFSAAVTSSDGHKFYIKPQENRGLDDSILTKCEVRHSLRNTEPEKKQPVVLFITYTCTLVAFSVSTAVFLYAPVATKLLAHCKMFGGVHASHS